MTRARINPFAKGTAEHVLFNHYRRNKLEAERKEQEAALMATDAAAVRAKAEHYAEALRSLGHGDKVTPLKQLPNYTGGRA
ncbi:hypothetical protein [Microcystis phage Mae-JY29]